MKIAKLSLSKARACASHVAWAAAQVPNGVRNLGFARFEDFQNDERFGTQQVKLRGNPRGVASMMELVMSTVQRYHEPLISQHRKIIP